MTDRSTFVRLGVIATGLKQGMKEAAAAARQTAVEIETAGRKADAALARTGKASAVLAPLMTRALTGLKTSSAALSKYIDKNRDSIDRLATSGMVVGGLLAAGAAVAAKKYADFDEAMSHVAATGTDARLNLGALREEAIKMGADTVFSAQEAAQGIEAMEKAGVSAKDILGGGLQGSLALAAAGSLSVADSAEVAATALVQFGLSGGQMSHVADLLAAGAGKAQGEVSDLALALNYVGPVASGMGVSIEETVGALAAFASQGLLADQAGTSLRGVLAALTSPSAQAKKEIDRLGITLYDSNGKFLGLSNMAGQLSKAYSGVTDQAKDASLGILFGNQQVTAARVLFDQGAKGIEGWTAQVDDAGYAASAAALRMDNLKGDIEKLSGSIDSALIKSGTGLNDVLRGMVQGAEKAVDAFSTVPAGVLSTTTALAGAGGLGVLGVSALAKLVVGINDAKIAMSALNITTKAAALSAGAIGIAVGLGALAFAQWANSAAEAKANTDDFAATLAVVDGKAITTASTLRKFNEDLLGASAGIGPWSTKITDLAARMGVSTADLQEALGGNTDAIAKINDASMEYWKNVETHLSPAQMEFTGSTGDVVTWLDKERTALGLAKTNVEAKTKADKDGGVAANSAADATKTVTSYLTDQTNALGDATTSLEDYETALWRAATAALKLSGTEIGYRQTVADAGKEIGDKNHKGKGLNTHTQAGRDNQTDLDKIVTSGKARVNALIEEKGAGKEASKAMKELRDDYIKAATAATGSAAKAKEMADELRLIPKNVEADIFTKVNKDGINAWYAYKPAGKTAWITPKLSKDQLQAHINILIHTGKLSADGNVYARSAAGLVPQRFADGGFPSIGAQQPQIRPYQGPQGLTWGEEGSGPWEAFVSGHPAKLGRSRAVAADVVGRLGGTAQFASGGIRGSVAGAPGAASSRPAPTAGEIASALADVLQSRGVSMLTIANGVTAAQVNARRRAL